MYTIKETQYFGLQALKRQRLGRLSYTCFALVPPDKDAKQKVTHMQCEGKHVLYRYNSLRAEVSANKNWLVRPIEKLEEVKTWTVQKNSKYHRKIISGKLLHT